jgi:hypothetical protein
MQTHNPENEITCEFCGKKYANRAKYQCHYKRIHSGKVYECTSCIQKFIRKEHLEAHLVSFIFIIFGILDERIR